MRQQKQSRPQQAYILLAEKFDEETVVPGLCSLRRNGILVCSVGLTAGLLHGYHGIALQPDLTLQQVYAAGLPATEHLLVIPGRNDCVHALLSDPRSHILIQSVLDCGGTIAALSPAAQDILMDAGMLTEHNLARFLPPGRGAFADYVDQLAGVNQ